MLELQYIILPELCNNTENTKYYQNFLILREISYITQNYIWIFELHFITRLCYINRIGRKEQCVKQVLHNWL